MKQLLNVLCVILVALPFLVSAQNNPCGTDFDLQMEERLKRNIQAIKDANFSRSGMTTYVPVRIHIVGTVAGNGQEKVGKYSVFQMLCKLNNVYAPQDIQFYLSGSNMNEFDNDVVYNHSNVNGARTQMAIRKVNNAINIFMCGNLVTSGSTVGTILGYYSPTIDVLAMRNAEANPNSMTLSHEAGHFFSLAHPHNGWEGTPYHNYDGNGSSYGPSNLPPSFIGGGSGIAVELADGSNCANAGDFVCDTPPDYNFGFTNGNGCTYNGNGVDPTGAPVSPDETNIMSYFSDNCVNSFSATQENIVAADLQSVTRNYLTNNPPTSTVAISGTPTLVAPANQGMPANFDNVTLNWDDYTDASGYLVQVALTASFTNATMVYEDIVNSSSVTLTNLDPNRTYFWRVMAFNEVSLCNGFSANRRFTTNDWPTAVQDIQGLEEITLRPNIASSGQSVILEVGTNKSFEAAVTVYNIAGQVVKNIQSIPFQSGVTNYELETGDLTPGVYIVNVLAETGMVSRKLVITK